MPKQIFQRPAPVKHQKFSKLANGAKGQPDFGRKTGKALKSARTGKTAK